MPRRLHLLHHVAQAQGGSFLLIARIFPNLCDTMLDVGSGIEVDVDDEANTFWVAFEEYINEVIQDPEVARSFHSGFMESHRSMFHKLNLEQLEGIAKGIIKTLRDQELQQAANMTAAQAATAPQ